MAERGYESPAAGDAAPAVCASCLTAKRRDVFHDATHGKCHRWHANSRHGTFFIGRVQAFLSTDMQQQVTSGEVLLTGSVTPDGLYDSGWDIVPMRENALVHAGMS